MAERENPDEPVTSSSAETSTSRHTYVCSTPVAGCTTYLAGHQYEFTVSDPPPDPYEYPGPGVCKGTLFMLDEEWNLTDRPRQPLAATAGLARPSRRTDGERAGARR